MSDKHFGKTYNLNGPAILSGPKVASIWSKVLGKEIKYAGVSFPSRCPHFSLRMSSYKCGSAQPPSRHRAYRTRQSLSRL